MAQLQRDEHRSVDLNVTETQFILFHHCHVTIIKAPVCLHDSFLFFIWGSSLYVFIPSSLFSSLGLFRWYEPSPWALDLLAFPVSMQVPEQEHLGLCVFPRRDRAISLGSLLSWWDKVGRKLYILFTNAQPLHWSLLDYRALWHLRQLSPDISTDRNITALLCNTAAFTTANCGFLSPASKTTAHTKWS